MLWALFGLLSFVGRMVGRRRMSFGRDLFCGCKDSVHAWCRVGCVVFFVLCLLKRISFSEPDCAMRSGPACQPGRGMSFYYRYQGPLHSGATARARHRLGPTEHHERAIEQPVLAHPMPKGVYYSL
jgi:hypothetical protein